jgi:hypothetical protein
MLAGNSMTGAVLSTTWIVWMQLLELPQSSYTTQVLNIVPVPLQPLNPVVLSKCNRSISAGAVQLSLISGLPKTEGSIDSPQLTWSEPAHMIVGGVTSTIRMFCVTLFELPHKSDTTQVRFSVPV